MQWNRGWPAIKFKTLFKFNWRCEE